MTSNGMRVGSAEGWADPLVRADGGADPAAQEGPEHWPAPFGRGRVQDERLEHPKGELDELVELLSLIAQGRPIERGPLQE